MIKCEDNLCKYHSNSNCTSTWWNEKYKKILEICADCGADLRGGNNE